MPFIRKIKNSNCIIAIWEMTESLTDLKKISENIKFLEYKSDKKNKEFILTRLLIQNILPEAVLTYNKYGAPEINTNDFISISHSNNLVVIAVSKSKVGIDIEKIDDRAIKLASKFISNENIANLSIKKATLIWCCKEAIYKWHQKGNLNFKDDIKIESFDVKESGEIFANFNDNKLTLNYKEFNRHFLVYLCK
jgi:phosphopantetheinyl transferase